MSGRGETPRRDRDVETDQWSTPVSFGATVYDVDGKALGEVRGVEEGGFFVTTRAGAERLSIEHARSGLSFGEAELMWRCMECGEMGKIDEGLPATCPNCAAEKEALMYWTED